MDELNKDRITTTAQLSIQLQDYLFKLLLSSGCYLYHERYLGITGTVIDHLRKF